MIEGNDSGIKDCYKELHDALTVMDVHQFLSLLDYQPEERYVRRHWIDDMKFPYPIALYTYHQGNGMGNLMFVWKTLSKDERCDGDAISVLTAIKEQIPQFSTRAMRKEFFQRYQHSTGVKPAILRDMWSYLTGDSTAAQSSAQASVDERMAKFLLNSDDPDLVYDLRCNNGRPNDPRLDPFWEELATFLEEKSIVDER